jgi:hypothetical protein
MRELENGSTDTKLWKDVKPQALFDPAHAHIAGFMKPTVPACSTPVMSLVSGAHRGGNGLFTSEFKIVMGLDITSGVHELQALLTHCVRGIRFHGVPFSRRAFLQFAVRIYLLVPTQIAR